jgi:hypothetical protein
MFVKDAGKGYRMADFSRRKMVFSSTQPDTLAHEQESRRSEALFFKNDPPDLLF